ncbi:MAG: hypothetical protein IPL97_06770 [Niastella sp.]|nr:hypothetical protein [Niastella sp.]
METGSIATQELYYANLSATQADKPAWFNDPALEDANNKVAKLKNDGVSQKIGPAILLKVMAGDSYNIRVVSGWNSGSTHAGNQRYSNLIAKCPQWRPGAAGRKSHCNRTAKCQQRVKHGHNRFFK